MGYGDLGSYNASVSITPELDRLAEEGMKLTSFYVGAPVCTPSRAALLTGSYPRRSGMDFTRYATLLFTDPYGLHPNEITIAEVLKDAGYKTGMFGKWHLGDQVEFLPTRQGFDEFRGVPYSHDIAPEYASFAQSFPSVPPLPLLLGESVIQSTPNVDSLVVNTVQHSVDFINRNKNGTCNL